MNCTRTPFLLSVKSFFFLLLSFYTVKSTAQGFLKAEGTKIVNEKGENVLLRGVGLGGWMLQEGYMLRIYREGQQYKIRERIENLVGAEKTEAFYDAWLRNHTRKEDIDSMKAWGFNSVRLPMHYNLYTLPVEKEPVAGQNTWLEKGFALTDSLLAWCKANQMYLILDLHAAPGGQGNDLNISDRDPSKPSLWESEANQQKTIALWRKLAERYKHEPWIGGYDIINEPNWGFEDLANDKNGLKEQQNVPLKKLMMDITKAIREVDQKHIIIIEGNGWGNNYKGILPPWDKNMVLSFHKYWNHNRQQDIQHMIDTRNQYNVPVWLGETGENSNVWFTEAVALLEKNNIGWAWWPLKKLGHNNPLEVRSNAGYNQMLAYWNNNGPRPSSATAEKALQQLANDLKLENNIIHRDVIDALIRQPHSSVALPFKNQVITNNTVIQAVDYDLGRNGTAYYDMDTADYHISGGPNGGNKGRTYRNDGVDIQKDSVAEAYHIYNTEEGEWLQYTVYLPKKGKYKLVVTAAAENKEGKLTVSASSFSQTLEVPVAGSSRQWQQLATTPVLLSKGTQTIRITIEKGGVLLKSFQFVAVP